MKVPNDDINNLKLSAKTESYVQKRGFMDYLTEMIGWIQIVFGCLVSTAILSSILYLFIPSTLTFVMGIIVTSIGLIVGIFWATKSYRSKGTMTLIGRYRACPELDNLDAPQ
jgi:hypothetical protein